MARILASPETPGVLGGCADDIGMALLRIEALRPIKKVFDVARVLAGLSLKPKK